MYRAFVARLAGGEIPKSPSWVCGSWGFKLKLRCAVCTMCFSFFPRGVGHGLYRCSQ